MDKFATQNACFFIHFVTFNINLVYSIIWNNSGKKIEVDAAVKEKFGKMEDKVREGYSRLPRK